MAAVAPGKLNSGTNMALVICASSRPIQLRAQIDLGPWSATRRFKVTLQLSP